MTTNLILTLEVISVFLVCIMLIQIRSHYVLSSSEKSKHKGRVTKKVNQATRNSRLQHKIEPNYYYHKLPELEVSISSEQDITPFTNSSFLRDSATNTQPMHSSRSTHKAVLNNYIDDFFSDTSAIEVQAPEVPCFTGRKVSTPANDEIITVSEPNEMV